MAVWRYATPEECVEFAKAPEAPRGVSLDQEVFPVVRGTIESKDGQVLSVPDGMFVKMLTEDGSEPWVYQVVKMSILLAQQEVELLPGTLVAVFRLEKS